jgi:CHAT domain-containing protein
MLIKKIIKLSLVIVLSLISNKIIACDQASIVSYLNNGNAIKSREVILECIDKEEDIKKADAVISLLLLDLMVDKATFVSSFNKHWEILSNQVNKTDIKTYRVTHSYLADYFQAFYNIALGISLDKKRIEKILGEEVEKINSSSHDGSAALKAISRAYISAAIGNYELAQIHLNRARILVLNQDMKRLDSQFIFSFFLFVSQYYLNENKDVRTFAKLFTEDNSYREKIITSFNVFSLLSIYKNIYDLTSIDIIVQEKIAEQIFSLNKQIILPEKNSFTHNLEDTQANEILKKYLSGDAKVTDLKKNDLLTKPKLQNLTAQGLKFYIELLQKNEASTKDIDTYIHQVELIKAKVGNLPLVNMAEASSFILQSLKERKKGDQTEELNYLKKFVASRFTALSSQKIKPGNKVPLSNSVLVNVDLLALKRLSEIAPNETATTDLAILCILQANASIKSEEIYSSFLNLATKNKLEKIQTDQYLSIYADYETQIYKQYKNILEITQNYNLSKDGGQSLKSQDLFINGKYLSSFSQYRSQTRSFENQEFNYYLISNELRKYLDKNSSIQLFGIVNGFGIYVNIDNEKNNVNFINPHELRNLKNLSEKILNFKNQRLDREKSLFAFSKSIFNNLNSNYQKVSFITGPTILGIPVTSLANPANGLWLVDTTAVNSYINHISLLPDSKDKVTKYKYDFLGVGNPLLRSSKEIASIKDTEILIRGKITDDLSKIPELPETEIELRKFLDEFKNNGFLLVGRNATKESLLNQSLSDFRIVNFATHGLLTSEIKGISSPSLLLTRTESDNGLLSISDILSMNGVPGITILSACNTGSSDSFIKETDITSLSSAFYIKGSSAIISSYWAVDSVATQKLMSYLAEEIKNNKKGLLSDFYRNAIIKLKLEKKYSDPIFWSAFSLIGDYQFDVEKNQKLNEFEFVKYFDSRMLDDNFYLIGSKDINETKLYEFSLSKNKLINEISLEDKSEINTGFVIGNEELNLVTITKSKLKIDLLLPKEKLLKKICEINLPPNRYYNFRNFIKINNEFFGLTKVSSTLISLLKINKDCSSSVTQITLHNDGDIQSTFLLNNNNILEVGVTQAKLTEKTTRWVEAGISELNTPIRCRSTELTNFLQIDTNDLSIIRQNTLLDTIIPYTKINLNFDKSLPLLKRFSCKDKILADSFEVTTLSGSFNKYVTPHKIYDAQLKNYDPKVFNFEEVIWWNQGKSTQLVLGIPLIKNYLSYFKNNSKNQGGIRNPISLFEFDRSRKITQSSLNSYSCSNYVNIESINNLTSVVCRDAYQPGKEKYRLSFFN